MSDAKYLTVVYRYKTSKELNKFYDANIQPLIHCLNGNENLPVTVASWYDGDAIHDKENTDD